MDHINLLSLFITGLLAGGISCIAIQGGLLAATVAQREEKNLYKKVTLLNHLLPVVSFLVAKLIAYTILGFFLGYLGSVFQISLFLQVILQLLVIIFMLGTIGALLNIHPFFRYFILQPPKFVHRFIRRNAKNQDIFAPVILGGLTVLIPCGATQAVMALAVGVANPYLGALMLFSFTLGTTPLFLGFGFLAAQSSSFLKKSFLRLSVFVLFCLVLYNLNATLILAGSPIYAQNVVQKFWCTVSYCDDIAELRSYNVVNAATIQITNNGYTPGMLVVRAGSRVSLRLINQSGTGCTQAFTIPTLGIQKVVPVGQTGNLVINVPNQKGDITFVCSAGHFP